MSILGAVSTAEFLTDYWQRKPLLVRGALPGYSSALTADELAGLALEEAVESRVVRTEQGSQPWVVRHGPFVASDLSSLPVQDWTLLVQAVDLWVPEVAALLREFDFIPSWRLDDIMISYAVPGGSVGPHFDQYDVFLIQVEGQRMWQVGGQCSPQSPQLADVELSILAEFEPQHEWVLEPGDMLYLPPGIAHWGIAQTTCMTYSVGFRSPNLADILGDFAVELLAQEASGHYRDPLFTEVMAGEEIPAEFVRSVQRQLMDLLDDEQRLGECFARFMTAPKYPGLEDLTGENRVARVAQKRFVNGELEE